MGNRITIKDGETLVAELDSDTPSLEELKKYVLNNRTTIKIENFSTSCDTDKFDTNTFNEAVKTAIKAELANLKIQDDSLAAFLKNIDEVKE